MPEGVPRRFPLETSEKIAGGVLRRVFEGIRGKIPSEIPRYIPEKNPVANL